MVLYLRRIYSNYGNDAIISRIKGNIFRNPVCQLYSKQFVWFDLFLKQLYEAGIITVPRNIDENRVDLKWDSGNWRGSQDSAEHPHVRLYKAKNTARQEKESSGEQQGPAF